MLGKTIRLTSDDHRWIELTVDRYRAMARVGSAEPFPFNFEHLGFVIHGMGYQAWGLGSHFLFRKADRGFAVEFQGPSDRSSAVCYLSDPELRFIFDDLSQSLESQSRAQML